MIGKKAIEELMDYVCSHKNGAATEVCVHAEDSLLTRFSHSTIHQNVQERNCTVSITAFVGKRKATAATNTLKREDVSKTLKQAITLAKHTPSDPDTVIPSPQQRYHAMNNYVPSTAGFSHHRKAILLKRLFERSEPYECFGAFSTGTAVIALGNSRGLRAYNKGTDAVLRLTVKSTEGSAFGQCGHRDIRALDFDRFHADVLARTRMAQKPRKAKPGTYTVLLTPEAVFEILTFLGFIGFNALRYSEGRSCLMGKLGKRIFSKKLTIVDDPLDERGFAFPFDLEGTPKKKLTLVEQGKVTSLVHDKKTAHRMKQRSTGHYTGPDSGPAPLNMVLKEGNRSLEQLRREIKKGIEVSALHYVNVVEPKSLTLTGMTRNGTFMIEDGAIAYPLKNLRFNQSILLLLKHIADISSTVRLVEGGNNYGQRFPWGFILPFVIVEDFNFTGETEF